MTFLNYLSGCLLMSANFVIRLNSSQQRESKHQTQSGVFSREVPAAAPAPAPATIIIIIITTGIGKYLDIYKQEPPPTTLTFLSSLQAPSSLI